MGLCGIVQHRCDGLCRIGRLGDCSDLDAASDRSLVSGRSWRSGRPRIGGRNVTLAIIIGGFFAFRAVFDNSVAAVEAINPASTGYLGGLNVWDNNLMVLVAWPVGGLLAAGAAWVIGKTALGLRSDYLAIATLGIAEIIIAVMKFEDWLARGVKNVAGLPRPLPYETDLQQDQGFIDNAASLGLDPVLASTLYVKLGYAILFAIVLAILLWLAQKALNSPWGRMMRAIRDNEVAAEAMGKDVTARHLQIFILGSATYASVDHGHHPACRSSLQSARSYPREIGSPFLSASCHVRTVKNLGGFRVWRCFFVG